MAARNPTQPPTPPTAHRIATTLGETEPVPTKQIQRIVQTLGEDRALQLMAQAVAIEQQGGQLLPDGSRRRTLGGIFFRLVRDQATPEQHRRIWPGPPWPAKRRAAQNRPDEPPLAPAPAQPA